MKKIIIPALILISLMALGLISGKPIWVKAQTEVTPSTFLTVTPNPDGIGFAILIDASIQPAVPYLGVATFTLNMTLPDGTYQVLSPFGQSTDKTSDSFTYQYTPTETGNFLLTFNFSGGSFNNKTIVYLPSENQTILTVAQNPYPSASPFLSQPSSLSSESEFRVIKTINVGDEPAGIAYDSGKGETFVVNENSGTVSVISDSANNSVIASITVGIWNPYGIAYDAGKGELFVTNTADNTVSVISDSNNTVIATIPVNQGTAFTNPEGIAYDPGKGELFVADNNVGIVSVISDSSNSVVATIPVGYYPEGVTYDSAKGEIFVTTQSNLPPFTGVSVISDSTNRVIASIPAGTNPANLAYDSGKGEIFVTNSGDNTVSVISDSTNTVIATLAVGTDPQGVAYDFGKGEVFVANHANNTVSVISDTNNTVIANVNGTSSPQGLAYDSAKSEIVVTNYYFSTWLMGVDVSNTVFVISDYPPLTAPTVSSFSGTVDRGQTSNLTSTSVKTGVSPYTYQWYSEAPGNLSFVYIDGAIAPSYNFATSTSTALGNWSFILEVTDVTGASVNSTACTVPVNVAEAGASSSFNLAAISVVASVIVVAGLLVYFKKRKR